MAGHLAESSLYQEDRFAHGHTTVFGSLFDTESKQWGYACCRTFDPHAPCPESSQGGGQEGNGSGGGSGGAAAGAVADEDEDDDARVARERWRNSRLLDDVEAIPAEVGSRSACQCDGEFVSRFVRFWFQDFVRRGAEGGRALDERAAQQSREALLPLLQQLQKGAVPKALLAQMTSFCDLAQAGEYAQANDVYVNLTIGKALWHSNLDLGEQRAHWGGGCSLRTMQRQVVEKDMKNASLFDTDPVVQRYVHALKRLVTHLQAQRPASAPSKGGLEAAPIVAPEDRGLPVFRHVRDGSGPGRGSLPEFAEPDDPRFSGASGERGIEFGARTDRTGMNVPTGRNSHPFAAV